MRLDIIALAIVLAVTGGLLLGGAASGGFFSIFPPHVKTAAGSHLPENESKSADTSGFHVNMKTTGSDNSNSGEGADEQAGNDSGVIETAPITGMTGGVGTSSHRSSRGSEGTKETAPAPFSYTVNIDTQREIVAAEFTLSFSAKEKVKDVVEGNFMSSSGSQAYIADKITDTSVLCGITVYNTTNATVNAGQGELATVFFSDGNPSNVRISSAKAYEQVNGTLKKIDDENIAIDGSTIYVVK